MIRDVGDGEARILEQPRGTHEASDGQVTFRRGQTSTKESAHEGAWQHGEILRQRTNGRDLRRCREEGLEESPAISRSAAQVDSELTQGPTLQAIDLRSEQKAAELAPAGGLAHVDELSHTALSEEEHRAWCARLDVGQQRNGRHARKFTHHHLDAGARDLIAASDRDENGRGAIGLQVLHDVIDVVAMKCAV